MKAYTGLSMSEDPVRAVLEATSSVPAGVRPDLVFAFASTRQSPQGVVAALAERFPGVPVVGCTTAGEIVDGQHAKGSLAVAALLSPEVRWSSTVVRGLADFDAAAAQTAADDLLGRLGLEPDEVDPTRHFCLTFIDGMSMKEERLAALMAEALGGMALVGGSAGDDLQFAATHVFYGREALSDAAVFIVGDAPCGFEVVKHQHFTATPRTLVVTRADEATRRVYEMNGYPAVEAYARAIGLPLEAVTDDVTFMNPVLFRCHGENFVRSIRSVEPDGSMVFYCAVEEGMVLSLGGHEDMSTALERDLAVLGARRDEPELLVACNCILRALEADKRDQHSALEATLRARARHAIGFDTYGEQLQGLHINQTLVGLALYSAPGARP